MIVFVLLLLAIPSLDAAPILFARYNSYLNTRVCLCAARLERKPDPELITVQERWTGIDNFIRRHVPQDFQDGVSEFEMGLAKVAGLAILGDGKKALKSLSQEVLERRYLLPLCRVFGTFQYCLSKRISQDHVNGDDEVVKLPLAALGTVRQVTQVLFQNLIERSLISPSDSYGYLCHEYRAGKLSRYWFHKSHPDDPFYEIFLAPDSWLALVQFATYEVREGNLYSKLMLFNKSQLQEASGFLAYNVSCEEELDQASQKSSISYIVHAGQQGCPQKKLPPFYNLLPNCFYGSSTFPVLSDAIEHLWSVQPGLQMIPLFFMNKEPQGEERINAALFLEYCCWILDGGAEKESDFCDLFRDEIVQEGATNFLDWIRQNLFRQKAGNNFVDFLSALLSQLEQPVRASEVSYYRKHFAERRGCFAYPVQKINVKSKANIKANACWLEKQNRLRALSRWTHYVILRYLGKMAWKTFRDLARCVCVEISKTTHDMESSAICVQKFVTCLIEKVMPQDLFPDNAMVLSYRKKSEQKHFAFSEYAMHDGWGFIQ